MLIVSLTTTKTTSTALYIGYAGYWKYLRAYITEDPSSDKVVSGTLSKAYYLGTAALRNCCTNEP